MNVSSPLHSPLVAVVKQSIARLVSVVTNLQSISVNGLVSKSLWFLSLRTNGPSYRRFSCEPNAQCASICFSFSDRTWPPHCLIRPPRTPVHAVYCIRQAPVRRRKRLTQLRNTVTCWVGPRWPSPPRPSLYLMPWWLCQWWVPHGLGTLQFRQQLVFATSQGLTAVLLWWTTEGKVNRSPYGQFDETIFPVLYRGSIWMRMHCLEKKGS